MEMTIKDLKKALKKYSDDAKVFIGVLNHDGCDTCGYGASSREREFRIIDLETKVVLEADD